MSSDSKRSRKAPGTIFVPVLKPSMLIEPHYFNLIVHFTSNSGIVTRSEREATMRLLVRMITSLGQTLVQSWTNVCDVGSALNQCLINESVYVETDCQANTRNMIPRVWCLPGGHGREWRLVFLSYSLGVALRLCKLWPAHTCLSYSETSNRRWRLNVGTTSYDVSPALTWRLVFSRGLAMHSWDVKKDMRIWENMIQQRPYIT